MIDKYKFAAKLRLDIKIRIYLLVEVSFDKMYNQFNQSTMTLPTLFEF